MNYAKLLLPIAAFCLITPFCLLIAIASSGAGHGTYLGAKLLFPYTMLSTAWANEITVPFIVAAIVQMPIYGVVIGLANTKNKFLPAAFSIISIHLLAVIVCFLFISGVFS